MDNAHFSQQRKGHLFAGAIFHPYWEAISTFIASARDFKQWPECRDILLEELNVENSWLPVFPIITCEAAGGNPHEAVPIAVAWYALRKAAHLIDAVQDGDPLPKNISSPQQAVNCALALVFEAFQIVTTLEDFKRVSALTALFSQSGFDSAFGYFLDMKDKGLPETLDASLENYWRVTILKSGSIFRAGAACGAIVANAQDKKATTTLEEYGYAVGVMLQILDDCRDFGKDDSENVTEKRLPLITLLALQKNDGVGGINESPTKNSLSRGEAAGIITEILNTWKARALNQLASLNRSTAVETLEAIIAHILKENESKRGMYHA